MAFEWVEKDLQSDELEHEIIHGMRRQYYKNKRKEAKKQYNGETLEAEFLKYLDEMYDKNIIRYYKWLSKENSINHEFDFETQTPKGMNIYIDVVGTHEREGRFMLNCSHKDYKDKLRYLDGEEGYLAFLYCGEWRFMRVSRKLPRGDISLHKGRIKHMKKGEFVFNHDFFTKSPARDIGKYNTSEYTTNQPLDVDYN